MSAYTVVIPTTGRENLTRVIETVGGVGAIGPAPEKIIVVDDRRGAVEALRVPDVEVPVQVVRTGGRGPAAARNAGWRLADTEWVAFLDDDVRPPVTWRQDLATDLAGLAPDVAATQARISVPLPADRKPTDDERDTAGLAEAWWITADMTFRCSALREVGGFDERFPRAFREDADLALRLVAAGHRLAEGARVTQHPPRDRGFLGSVRAQAGNADNALMRRLHGPAWRALSGTENGRLGRHVSTTAAGLTAIAAALTGRRRTALAAAAVWAGLTGGFAAARIKAGPATVAEVTRMLVTSALIPPAAVWHRLRGWAAHRPGRRGRRVALLFDRDDTLIVDVPYLADPGGVEPVEGAEAILDELRAEGVPIGVVSNQSGVAKGLITPEQLAAVNGEVDRRLGPFQTWQVCPHDDADGCGCRKPMPGMVHKAAAELGVDPGDCVLIGDTGGDVAAALAAGARAVLVPTERTLPHEVEHARRVAHVAEDLRTAVRVALGGAR